MKLRSSCQRLGHGSTTDYIYNRDPNTAVYTQPVSIQISAHSPNNKQIKRNRRAFGLRGHPSAVRWTCGHSHVLFPVGSRAVSVRPPCLLVPLDETPPAQNWSQRIGCVYADHFRSPHHRETVQGSHFHGFSQSRGDRAELFQIRNYRNC